MSYKIEYLKALVASLVVGNQAVFAEDFYEYEPKQHASEITGPRAVARDRGITPEVEEGRGQRTEHQAFVTVEKSRARNHHEFQIDLWVKDLDDQVGEKTLGDQADEFIEANRLIRKSATDRVEVEFLGATIVEDENDDYYKVVIRLKFIEDKYRTEHVPLLPAADQIDIGVTT